MITKLDDDNVKILFDKLQKVTRIESDKHNNHNYPSFPKSEKNCDVSGCSRVSIAKGMCNAHYIRNKKDMDMSIPLANRKNPDNCFECGSKMDHKGGWGRCSRCYKNYRRSTLKRVCMSHLGGSCSSCGKIYPNRAMDFHYIKNKEHMVSFVLVNMSLERIAREVSKCILLCANCSRELVNLDRGNKLVNLEVKVITHPNNPNLDKRSELIRIIKDSLLYQISKYSVQGSSVSENRDYLCSVSNCERNGYANGMCNVHYIRNTKGKDLSYPNKSRREHTSCIECSGDISKHSGGWQRCGGCYTSSRHRIIKTAAALFFGDKCKKCKESFNPHVYDFHHPSGKDFSPASVMGSRSVEVVADELLKCELLCANCHRLEHIDN